MVDKKQSGVSHVTIITKADSNVYGSNAIPIDDEFRDMYFTQENADGAVVQPPYEPKMLMKLVTENNALSQLVSAMEVNVDGTGYEIDTRGDDDPTPEEKKSIESAKEFFDEPYPGESFMTQRKAIRRDKESCGLGYLEVIRNPADDVVFTRHVEAKSVRMLRLTDPIPVKKTITRNGGKEETVTVMVRERAFVQKVGNKAVYFKEFGASRDIDKKTGKWSKQGERLPAADRGSELILFGVDRDVSTPYYVPRWISQIPSVIGSRQAEEMNLEFFDNGGIPPAMIFIGGGTLTDESKLALNTLLSGKAKNKLRAAICELMSTGGTIDSGGGVNVNVERFGSEKQNDSMFEGYDEKCEKRIRSSFRLPPLFVGKAEDYSFATAFASYTIAETQVFKPERMEFDETINVTLMRSLGFGDLIYRSKPLAINDSPVQLKGIDMAKNYIDPEAQIKAINETAGLNLKYDPVAHQEFKDSQAPKFPPGTPGAQPTGKNPKKQPQTCL